jgi:ATP-dependent Clp protease, protease subunit
MHFPTVVRCCLLPSAFVLLGQPARVGAQSEGLEEVVVKADAPPATPAAPESPAEAAPTEEGKDTSKPATPPVDKELEKIRKERERISAENQLAQEKLRSELFGLESEKQRLQLQNSLRAERLNAEVADVRSKLDRMTLEIDVVNRQASLEAAQRRVQLDSELAAMRAEEERLRVTNGIVTQKLEAQMAEMRLKEAEYKVQRAALENDVARLQTELSLREKTEILRDIVPDEQKYVLEPFRDGVLLVSDRRIALNGVIVQSVADHILERIDYYNNQNTEYPIFIIIDYSPGGSAMSGYKILKAMDGSKAPVYVVVKSFAASMAAVITTMANRSFAYPNAILLHHQMRWLGAGNLTQQREQLEEAEQWWRRIAQPVAAKMGLSLDAFIKRMYEKNSDGDWREFADDAQRLKWVSEVVSTIWETSMDKNPDRFGSKPVITLQLEEKVDEQGNPYVVLPRLPPLDCYFLYNPDGYFRLR